LFLGTAGSALSTAAQLQLRVDHAFARDAVTEELIPETDLGPEFVREWGLFEVTSLAASRMDYLRRPDLGRRLGESARQTLTSRCPTGADLQVVIGDGLSIAAVRTQVPRVLPALAAEARQRGWRWGQPFLVRHARVGILNDVGETLDPQVAVLLIGERPGLATAESLSAYMAYRPRHGHTDANRNLISNVHARGVTPEDAARRIAGLAQVMIERQASGSSVKERDR
jgi:ethanolamine ammonia-lyase small subunit